MQRLNMTVLRTWAFNDGAGWQALQTRPGVYDERVFRCANRHCGSKTPERPRHYQLLRLLIGILFRFAQRSDPIDTRQQDMQLYCLIRRVYTPGAGLRPKSAFAKLQLRKALVTYEPSESVGIPPLQPGAGLGHRAGPQHNLRLVLTLTGQYPGYGGAPQYVNWTGGSSMNVCSFSRSSK